MLCTTRQGATMRRGWDFSVAGSRLRNRRRARGACAPDWRLRRNAPGRRPWPLCWGRVGVSRAIAWWRQRRTPHPAWTRRQPFYRRAGARTVACRRQRWLACPRSTFLGNDRTAWCSSAALARQWKRIGRRCIWVLWRLGLHRRHRRSDWAGDHAVAEHETGETLRPRPFVLRLLHPSTGLTPPEVQGHLPNRVWVLHLHPSPEQRPRSASWCRAFLAQDGAAASRSEDR